MANFIPIASHLYFSCIIGRNPNRGALRWQSYCEGRFLSADTLAGIKRLIREAMEGGARHG
jgi:hypothetical protein